MARNDGEIYVKRSRGIFSFQRTPDNMSRSWGENKEAINESYSAEGFFFSLSLSFFPSRGQKSNLASLNNRAAAV